MNSEEKKQIIKLFENHFSEEVENFVMLPPSGSYREYCRLTSDNRSVIGVFNADIKENTAFLSFTGHFRKNNLPVPEIYSVSSDLKKYLTEDLGDTTLFGYITDIRGNEGFSENIIAKYREVLSLLPGFQVVAGKDLDYSVGYPREAFDKQSMMWDLNYFKYYFLKLAKISFDEQALEDDFQVFSDYLLSASSNYFMYRDFQSSNIMLKENNVYFIDYQGGRRGPLQYDVASLLYDSKADIPQEVRMRLLDYYISVLKNYIPVNENEFNTYFTGFSLIRLMQAMGAYGFRGYYEKKEEFLKSIPFAVNNLAIILSVLDIPVKLPELLNALSQVTRSDKLKEIGSKPKNLTVRITSFSYKRGIPEDPYGNGGGFVFDCRALNNPGRYPDYKDLSGKDLKVQQFLDENSEMKYFFEYTRSLVGQSVKNYLTKGFTHLCINFGCTGGRHRSVYAAEMMAGYIRNNFPVNVVLVHRELEY
ncbi:MAG: RNase adapter RapZ [Prolixibacteraceae bacterium]|nr:RNase adapter RapZ [Prolixibacteraceae bacterium]